MLGFWLPGGITTIHNIPQPLENSFQKTTIQNRWNMVDLRLYSGEVDCSSIPKGSAEKRWYVLKKNGLFQLQRGIKP